MNSEKKKRLIIPAVTLVVAIVMMAGVGYAALQSTFEVNENSAEGGKLEVNIDSESLENGKIFEKAKIPYGVKTVDRTPTYTVYKDTYTLAKDKSIKIIDETNIGYASYEIEATISSEKVKLLEFTLECKITKTSSDETTTNIGNKGTVKSTDTLTMDVLLTVGDDKTIENPNVLTLNDISIIITLTGNKENSA